MAVDVPAAGRARGIKGHREESDQLIHHKTVFL